MGRKGSEGLRGISEFESGPVLVLPTKWGVR